MIEPAFGASLMPAVGAAALSTPGFGSALFAAIALSAIAVPADPEHCVTSHAKANPLTKHHLAMSIHARRQAGLDNGERSWQVGTSLLCGYLLKVAIPASGRSNGRTRLCFIPAFDEELYTCGFRLMIDG